MEKRTKIGKKRAGEGRKAAKERKMGRNIERDEQKANQRKTRLIQTGFRLFSRYGIENVSMQSVADHAGVAPATMYNYYKTKVNLAIAISGYLWKNFWDETSGTLGMEKLTQMNAYELIVHYTDSILLLYRTRPDVLKFSGNYKTFVVREGAQKNQLAEHLSVLEPIGTLFHLKFEEAKTNRCINTEIPEQEMFTTVTLTMLGMAERYAEGIVWADNCNPDHQKELEYTRDMILSWVRGDARNS